MAKFIDKDLGLKRIIAEVNAVRGREITVGIQNGEKGKRVRIKRKNLKKIGRRKRKKSSALAERADVATYAIYNEFGTKNIPSRPFMRDAVDTNRDRISNYAARKVMQAIVNDEGVGNALERVGNYTKGIIQNEITAGSFTANAKATVAKKGSSQPLIDSGTLRKSITYKVT